MKKVYLLSIFVFLLLFSSENVFASYKEIDVLKENKDKYETIYIESNEICNIYYYFTTLNNYSHQGYCNAFITNNTYEKLHTDGSGYTKVLYGNSFESAYPLRFTNKTNPNDTYRISLGNHKRLFYFKFLGDKNITYEFTITRASTNNFKIVDENGTVLKEFDSSSDSNILLFTPKENKNYYILLDTIPNSIDYHYLDMKIKEVFNTNETKSKEYKSGKNIQFNANFKQNKTYQLISTNHKEITVSRMNKVVPYSFYDNFTSINNYSYLTTNEESVTSTIIAKLDNEMYNNSNISTFSIKDGSSFENAFISNYSLKERGFLTKNYNVTKDDDIYLKVYLEKDSDYVVLTDELYNIAVYDNNKNKIISEDYENIDKDNNKRYVKFKADYTGFHYLKTTSNITGSIKLKFGQLYSNKYINENGISLMKTTESYDQTFEEPYYNDYYLYDVKNNVDFIFESNNPVYVEVFNPFGRKKISNFSKFVNEGKICLQYTDLIGALIDNTCNPSYAFTNDIVAVRIKGTANTIIKTEDYTVRKAEEEEKKKKLEEEKKKLENKEYYGNNSNESIEDEIFTADPINTMTGSFYTNYNFLQFNGTHDFGLRLNYDSIRGDLSNFGYNWEYEFGSKLTFNTDNTMNIHFNNSKKYLFLDENQDGIFESKNNDLPYSKLYKEGNNYYLILENGTKYEYNENGILKKSSNKLGHSLSYIYDNINGQSELIKVTDDLTSNTIRFNYDKNGLIIKAYDNYGRNVVFNYDENKNLISFVNENGYKTTISYNYFHQITSIKDNNEFVKNIYEDGRVVKQYDADNNLTIFEYQKDINDKKDFQTIVTDRNGNKEYFIYNQNYQLIGKIDKNGNKRTFVHSDTHLIEEIDELNNSIKYEYDNNGNLISMINAKGIQMKYEYDANNNLIKTIEPNGVIIKNEYNQLNQLIKTTDEKNNLLSEYFYNELGFPIKIIGKNGSITENVYNNKYQITSIKINGDTSYLEYDDFGNNTKITTPENTIVKMKYDKVGNLIEQEDNEENKIKYEYNFSNKKTKVIDANGVEENYEYDGNLNLTKIKKSDAVISYKYDKEGNVVEEIDANGNTTKYKYDNIGNVIKQIDSNNTETIFEYDKKSRLIKMSRLNRTVSYEYDENDNLISEIDALGNKKTYEYDLTDLLITETDALGNKTKYEYDFKGNLIKTIDAENNSISYEYDNADNVVKITDAKGYVTQNIYDINNRLIQTINSLGQSNFYSYDKNGNLIQTFDNLSRSVYKYQYDYNGRIISTTDGLNHTSNIEYDKNGNVTKLFDNKNNLITETVYDEFNRPIQYKDINGNVELLNYDKNGNIISQVDALNRSQVFSYDVMDNLVSVIDKNNITSEQVFNELQELIGYEDPNENTTNIEYDKLGRVIKELNASGGYSTYEYDAVGNLIKSTNAKNEVTTYKYDKVGNLIELKDNVSTIKYSYDKNYNVIKIEETGKNPIIQSYDALNRLTSVIDSKGKEIKYEYNEVGNLSKLIYPDGKEVHYVYDVMGNLLKVTDWNNRTTSYTYDENNQLLTTTKSDGSVEIREYNNKSQLSRLINKDKNGEIISDTNYEYDAVGNVIGEGEEDYTYDNLDRLTSSNNSSYTYDNAGNITNALSTNNSVANNTEMTYGADNRIQTFNDMTLTMDNEGNLLTVPKKNELMNASYDERNRLISLDNDSYEYDALNNRISVIENNQKTNFVFNNNTSLSQMLMEYDENDNPIAYYVYGIGLISKEDVNGDNYIYHYDKRGSTIALTKNGEITDTYKYDNYGEILEINGNTDNRFMYNGKYGVQTDDSGLYYMRARYYSPEMKRFINRDIVQGSITESQTFNRFAYVNGNPVSYIDPFGLERELADKDSKSTDTIHKVLDVAEFVPGVGQVAAAANGTLHLLEGDFGEAAESFIAILPFGKYATTGAKGIKAAKKISEGKNKVSKTKKKSSSRSTKKETCNCFVAGTLVLTLSGYVPIEDIQIGDQILTKDEITGDITYKPVEATIENEKEIIYTIVIDGEEIKVSDSHPFWVENEQQWIASKDLLVGDVLQTANGQLSPIDDIIVEERKVKVYNLTVADYHTYFVSELGLWVHNAKCSNTIYNSNEKLSPSNYPNPDPPMNLPPVKYEPKTIDEVVRMRGGNGPTTKGTHGNKNIEAHHRQQIPVKDGGILDELEQETHRGKGNHTRHNKPSQLTSKQRKKEIKEHYKKRGSEYILPGEGI